MAESAPIIFASDFGPGSEWVGICHAVIAKIAPAAKVIDLTHALEPFDVPGASQTLRSALPYAPAGIAVFVVDPGVGSVRRAVALLCGRGDILVGPDNGLLPSPAAAVDGIVAARELANSRFHLSFGSTTFHARDVFCPVAAHLADGAAFEELGPSLALETLEPSWIPEIRIVEGKVRCDVTNVDRFGNVRLAIRADALRSAGIGDLRSLWVLGPEGEVAASRAATFADVEHGHLGLIEDSFGSMCLCINKGSAAQRLGVRRSSPIELRARS